MKAIVQDTYGSAEVLRLDDIEKPVPGAGELLVRVHAAGVDQGVWHLLTGQPYLLRLMGFGLRAPAIRVRGSDVAGRVEAVGEAVTGFEPGEEVYGSCDGSYAEYARVDPQRAARKPRNLTFEQAAAVPVSACTALRALRDRGEVRSGQRVMIIGAAGGVGTFAVQLAKAFGAEVTAVCGTTKVALVRSIGADHVIDYHREDIAGHGRHYDLILDIAGNRSLTQLRRALTRRGTLVLVGGEGGRWVGPAVLRSIRALLLAPFVRQRLRGLYAAVRRNDLEFLRDLMEAGKITPVIDRSYPLSKAPEAIRRLHEVHASGKTVITV